MFYWTLGNLDLKVRSSQNSIQLLAVVKAKIEDILRLRTKGITIVIVGKEINFKGSLLFCAGNTTASALLGGYKESVSAIRFCRTCLVRREEWKPNLNCDFVHRDATSQQ